MCDHAMNLMTNSRCSLVRRKCQGGTAFVMRSEVTLAKSRSAWILGISKRESVLRQAEDCI
jgi:hypothetical protein